ncbi:MAG: 3-coathanger stack domain-containing protein, partial [Bacteroidota bacterium]
NKLRASTYGRGAWESEVHCLADLTIASSNPIPFGTYRSQGELTSHSSTVANGTSVVFKSDTSVLLTHDFEVVLGAVFEAAIQSCAVMMMMGGN